MKTESISRSIALAAVYFLFATILTFYFIAKKFWLYDSIALMTLSGGIAGAKWAVQIVAALILLKEERWLFIKRIGLVALLGSVALIIYYVIPYSWGFATLVISVAFSVLVMIGLYYRAVKKSGISIAWFWGWIACLTVAILLQLTVVFDVI